MLAKIGNLDNRYTQIPSQYTIAFLPDTQYMTEVAHQTMFLNMMQWLATNKATLNLKAVVGVGDIAQSHLDAEYQNAIAGLAKLDAVGVPYVLPPGNHDYNSTSVRTLTTYNIYFSPTHYAGKSWYGTTNYETGKGENSYITFYVGSRKYIIFGLEFYPRSQVFTWAQGIIDANKDAYVIMSTHGYIDENSTRLVHGGGGSHGPDSYGLSDLNNYDAQQMWDNFIKINPTVRIVLCGHDTGSPFINYREDNNNNRVSIHQIRSDYQTENYGNGNVVLMQFCPQVNTITLRVYSTVDSSFVGSPIVIVDDDYIPSLTVDTLKYTNLDSDVCTFKDSWSGSVTYSKYDIVTSGDYTYVSIVDNNLNNNPADVPSNWTKIATTVGGGGPSSDTLADVVSRGRSANDYIELQGITLSRTDDLGVDNSLYYRSDLGELRIKIGSTPYRINVSPV